MTKGEKWTAGPWQVVDDIYVEDLQGTLIADFAPLGGFGPTHEACARVAAASPQLYAALKGMVEAFADIKVIVDGEVQPETDPVVIAARSALSAALGQGE